MLQGSPKASSIAAASCVYNSLRSLNGADVVIYAGFNGTALCIARYSTDSITVKVIRVNIAVTGRQVFMLQ